MDNNNNINLYKEVVEIESSSYAFRVQHNCNLAIIKLELFSNNILIIYDDNDVECYVKTVKEIESFIIIRNAFILIDLLVINNSNNVEFCGDVMIKINRYLFKLVTTISNYIEMFTFDEDYLIV